MQPTMARMPRLALPARADEVDTAESAREPASIETASARVRGLRPRPPLQRPSGCGLVQSARERKAFGRPGWNTSPRVARQDISQYLVGGAPCDADFWRRRATERPGKTPRKALVRRDYVHDRSVRCLALLWPSLLLSGCEGGVVVLRRIVSGSGAGNGMSQRIEGIYRGHRGAILDACALGAQRFATASEDCTARVWRRPRHIEGDEDCETFSEASSSALRGHTGPVVRVVCVYSASQLLTASVDTSVRVWRLDTLSCTAVLGGHFGGVAHMRLVARWQHAILVVSPDGGLRIWERPSSSVMVKAQGNQERALTSLGSHETPQADPAPAPVYSGQLGSFISRVTVSAPESHLCVGCKNGAILVFALAETLRAAEPGTPLQLERRFEQPSEVTALAVCGLSVRRDAPADSRDAETQVLVAGFRSGDLVVFNLTAGLCVRRLRAHRSWIMDVKLHSPLQGTQRTSPKIVTCAFDGSVRVCSLLLSDDIDLKPHSSCAHRLVVYENLASALTPGSRRPLFVYSCAADGKVVCSQISAQEKAAMLTVAPKRKRN